MKKVIVYCTGGCPWCIELKEYLKSHDIHFDEIDVSKDKKAADDMFERSGVLSVPQVWIDHKFIVGFDKKKLKQELEIED